MENSQNKDLNQVDNQEEEGVLNNNENGSLEGVLNNNEKGSVEAAFETKSIETCLITEDKNTSRVKSEEKEIKRPISSQEPSIIRADIETVFSAIEEAFPKTESTQQYAFPHPMRWVGPRFLAFWAIPIVLIKKIQNLLIKSNPVKPYKEMDFSVKSSSTIYTSTKEAITGQTSMRFFGARFLTIWVLPMAITGIFMEYLFVSPLMGVKPFG